MKWPALLLLTGLASANERDGVLVESIPVGVESAQALTVTREAFIGRGWIIENTAGDSLTATLAHNKFNVRMHVRIAGTAIKYEADATRQTLGNPPGQATFAGTSRAAKIPRRWIEAVRADISKMLAVLSAEASDNEAGRTAAERLKALDKLRASALISPDEYDRKRAEILGSL